MTEANDSPDASGSPEMEDIAGHTRLGPGTIDSLRFKWTVRREENGYFVDETIGASRSPVSRGPMSREIALDFIEARYRDASARFEHRRDKLANPSPLLRRPASAASPPPLPVPEGAVTLAAVEIEPLSPPIEPVESPAASEPVEQAEPAETESIEAEPVQKTEPVQTGLAHALLASAAKPDSRGQRVDLEDVMKRISRLLDER